MASTSRLALYPDTSTARDRWILTQRGPRVTLDPERPYAFLREKERTADGRLAEIATVFLTNRECPWRCVMCDLWRHTLPETSPAGAIPRQIRYALDRLGPAEVIKLYNSGSFFDPRAIPPEEHAAIAREVSGFERVIVECHPSLVGERCFAFGDRLSGGLEVAMGLETAHPVALEKLNKQMTLDQYATAAERLLAKGIALRSFVLVSAPFVPRQEAKHWVRESIDFALACGAEAVSLIPVRDGNGAMEALAASGEFHSPALTDLEEALDYGVSLRRARVFADLWDVERFAACGACREERIARLGRINLTQALEPRVCCVQCETTA